MKGRVEGGRVESEEDRVQAAKSALKGVQFPNYPIPELPNAHLPTSQWISAERYQPGSPCCYRMKTCVSARATEPFSVTANT